MKTRSEINNLVSLKKNSKKRKLKTNNFFCNLINLNLTLQKETLPKMNMVQ